MLINLSVQIGKLRHDAGRPVPCHTRSFTHRAKEKPPSWVRNLVLKCRQAYHCPLLGLRDMPEKGHFTLCPFLLLPLAVTTRHWQGRQHGQVHLQPGLAQPPQNPQRNPHHTGAHHTTPPSLPNKRGCWGHTRLQGRRTQSHHSQPAERTRYKLLKSRSLGCISMPPMVRKSSDISMYQADTRAEPILGHTYPFLLHRESFILAAVSVVNQRGVAEGILAFLSLLPFFRTVQGK